MWLGPEIRQDSIVVCSRERSTTIESWAFSFRGSGDCEEAALSTIWNCGVHAGNGLQELRSRLTICLPRMDRTTCSPASREHDRTGCVFGMLCEAVCACKCAFPRVHACVLCFWHGRVSHSGWYFREPHLSDSQRCILHRNSHRNQPPESSLRPSVLIQLTAVY